MMLLDLKMPECDGLEVLRDVRKDGALRTLPLGLAKIARKEYRFRVVVREIPGFRRQCFDSPICSEVAV